MSDVYLDHLTVALGEETRTVEETVAAGKTVSGAAALREAGFRQHHVSREGTTAYDLARRAVEAIRPHLEGVGAIVYSTCIPANGNLGSAERYAETGDVKHLMDFPASRLQAEFGLDRAVVVGLNQQACTGLLGSMHLAHGLLLADPDLPRVLCVTADRFPPGALYEQSYSLISDGAAGGLVSRDPGRYRLIAWHGITNGALATASDDETVGSYFSFTHRAIEEGLRRAGMTPADLAWVVPQNMNVKAWQILSRLLPVPGERVFAGTMAEVGHLVSGDNIANLMALERGGRVRPGDRILLVIAGYGLNWQCLILERR